MDSATHLVMGIGLGGLSTLDPVVAADPTLQIAVIIGVIAGSQAPDSDTILRLYNNASYIRHHRGISHSIPAIMLWTVLISIILQFLFSNQLLWIPLLSWIFFAVSLHVFVDLFNTYGTQALQPFSSKWVAWNIIPIFDPFIFITHCAAILIWMLNLMDAALLFPFLYGLLVLYFIGRSIFAKALQSYIRKHDPDFNQIKQLFIIPTIKMDYWHIVKQLKDDTYVLGNWIRGEIVWNETIRSEQHLAIEHSKKTKEVKTFLYFTSYACSEVSVHEWGYEVRWSDVRYRHRVQYPFVTVLFLDKNYNKITSYIGWLSDKKLEKRLNNPQHS